MDNKGFVGTILIYSLFVFFVALILFLIRISTNSVSSKVYGSDVIKEHVNKIVPYDVCLEKEEC
ncbi:MAG: hypothetical protein E7166_05850 [Firmicutes bacterium]|nr:hypothetical protein [Bacillota bacterium]